MAEKRFGEFTFDPVTLQLRRGSTALHLRPKTGRLLRELIDRRTTVIGKRELIAAVWGSDHVPDQSLFQAISELRRALAPLTPIRTVPNVGYRWVEPLRRAPLQRSLYWAAGMAATAVLAVTVWAISGAPAGDARAQGLPLAWSALARGIDELDAGNATAAERYFRISQAENPAFSEAQLLLAEALLRQGKTLQARELALKLVARTPGKDDAYTSVVAMELVSRVAQRDGRSDMALQWALDASEQAAGEGLMCMARDLNERLRQLLAMTADAPVELGVRMAAADEAATAQCDRLRRGLETSDAGPQQIGMDEILAAHRASRRPVFAAV